MSPIAKLIFAICLLACLKSRFALSNVYLEFTGQPGLLLNIEQIIPSLQDPSALTLKAKDRIYVLQYQIVPLKKKIIKSKTNEQNIRESLVNMVVDSINRSSKIIFLVKIDNNKYAEDEKVSHASLLGWGNFNHSGAPLSYKPMKRLEKHINFFSVDAPSIQIDPSERSTITRQSLMDSTK